ncbi:hypothetical protein C1H46_001724 [Malus baccata]|uniref:Uncharacterized protein n=1 Tax=Malus baccata TaxID=106549 RepID=A0A540NNT5_MALBA|nr:hypothetical protein C1H46_001724 [Malus baccata]
MPYPLAGCKLSLMEGCKDKSWLTEGYCLKTPCEELQSKVFLNWLLEFVLNHHLRRCTNLVPIADPWHKEVVPVHEADVKEIKPANTVKCELSESGGRGGTVVVVF